MINNKYNSNNNDYNKVPLVVINIPELLKSILDYF